MISPPCKKAEALKVIQATRLWLPPNLGVGPVYQSTCRHNGMNVLHSFAGPGPYCNKMGFGQDMNIKNQTTQSKTASNSTSDDSDIQTFRKSKAWTQTSHWHGRSAGSWLKILPTSGSQQLDMKPNERKYIHMKLQ